jgi:transposase
VVEAEVVHPGGGSGVRVAHGEDVLDLYEEPHDSNKPLICFDELPYQLVAETRVPLPAKPGQPARHDYEYERKGTTNLFAFFEPKGGFRRVEVSERRTAKDFALAMKRLVDELYPQAETIRLVLDDLNTHTPAALYGAFEPAEARRIARKLEFHYTPKHASWLNQVEIELSVLHKQCLGGRRIPDEEMLGREVGAWERERNQRGATVEWRFTASDAREKLARLYPAGS